MTLDEKETVARQRLALADLAMKGAVIAWRRTSVPGTAWRLHEANVATLQAAVDRYERAFAALMALRNGAAAGVG